VEDISGLAGLGQRSPFLAAAMTLAMVSLTGIPPLAGFFGKFLLLKSALEQGPHNHAYYWLVAIAVAGVVISIWYYFGVIRAIYWSRDTVDLSPVPIALPIRLALHVCIAGMLILGLLPGPMVNAATKAAKTLERGKTAGFAIDPTKI